MGYFSSQREAPVNLITLALVLLAFTLTTIGATGLYTLGRQEGTVHVTVINLTLSPDRLVDGIYTVRSSTI